MLWQGAVHFWRARERAVNPYAIVVVLELSEGPRREAIAIAGVDQVVPEEIVLALKAATARALRKRCCVCK